MSECIFCKILAKEIPTEVLYEDDLVMAFPDVSPQAPEHILIIPKKHIPSLADLSPEDEGVMGRIVSVANRLAQEKGFAQEGYRLVANCGKQAGQTVFHIHFHLLGGRDFGWPPG
ncbi:MAG: histidine triad nucleotide-binding protein [Firmicutes bacterium]|nr:histidine triad nucleotide-binding protein [Bacillota bacterium]